MSLLASLSDVGGRVGTCDVLRDVSRRKHSDAAHRASTATARRFTQISVTVGRMVKSILIPNSLRQTNNFYENRKQIPGKTS